jgi:hypothetical protein
MSASAFPMPLVVPGSPAPQNRKTPPPPAPDRIVRRRPDMHQGRALEVLGHAIEYLVDSRMFLVKVQILSRCSREVFATCAEVVPVHHRFKQWAAEHLRAGSLQSRTRRI